MQSVKDLIIVKDLKKHFGQIKAVDGVDFVVREGESSLVFSDPMVLERAQRSEC
jgi:ABC-type branched-subunit amino acid transport system ATPase component